MPPGVSWNCSSGLRPALRKCPRLQSGVLDQHPFLAPHQPFPLVLPEQLSPEHTASSGEAAPPSLAFRSSRDPVCIGVPYTLAHGVGQVSCFLAWFPLLFAVGNPDHASDCHSPLQGALPCTVGLGTGFGGSCAFPALVRFILVE